MRFLSIWFLANFNMPFPANCCNIYYGAVFAMRRDKILSRSKEFYQKLLRQLVYTNAPIEAHFLERSWWYIPHHTFSNTRFYGICLKDIKERLYKIKAIQDILPQLEVVNAIDAQRNLSDQDIQTLKNNNFFVQRNDEYVDSFGRAYQKGAVACFLSHKKVMEMVKAQKEEYAVVFEDDIRLLPDFHEKMYKVFEMLGDAEFDICNLHVHSQQRDPTISQPEIFWAPPGFIGTQCLLLKKSSVHRVLASLQQYGDPIDEQLSRDLDLQYIYITNIDLLICDEIPSVIQDPHLKYLTI